MVPIESEDQKARRLAEALRDRGYAHINNDDGSRYYIVVERPITMASEVVYRCSMCGRSLRSTVAEQCTTGRGAVATFIRHRHEAS